VLRCSAVLIISALFATSVCISPLAPSFLFIYSLSMSAFGWCVFYIVSIFIVFWLIFFISSFLHSFIPKLYLNAGTANAPIAVILFLEFSLEFSIILNLLLYSYFNPSLICWCCMSSLSSIPRHLYLFFCSSSSISLLVSITKFYE